ncbi:MAG: oligosaccharide flippase family protein [Planctomycetota bacterium]
MNEDADTRPAPAAPTGGGPEAQEPLRGGRVLMQRESIRGSALLLSGRAISLVVNFLVHVLTIHYLSTLDYGVFGFALAFAEYGAILIAFGMAKSVARFAPIYDERGDWGRVLGTVVLAAGTILALTIASVVVGVLGFERIAGALELEPASRGVFAALCLLAPLTAIDSLLESIVATLGATRAVFARRYVVRPGLRLVAVVSVIAFGGGVQAVAIGHAAAAAVGVAAYLALLVSVVRRLGLWPRIRATRVVLPTRELLWYSMPQVGSDLNLLARASLLLVALQQSHGAAGVAAFLVVQPLAKLNRAVIEAFSVLYAQTASRLWAREEHAQLSEHYWRTSGWITLFSFPLFAVTFVFAEPVTVLVLGERYAASSDVLALVSLGFFAHGALGFNGRTLAVEGRVGLVFALELATTAVAVALYAALVPERGALGAGVASCGAFLAYGAIKEAGLLAASRSVRLQPAYLRPILLVAAAGALLWVAQDALGLPLWVGLPAVAAVWLALVAACRDLLDVRSTIPELGRLGPIGRWLSGPA